MRKFKSFQEVCDYCEILLENNIQDNYFIAKDTERLRVFLEVLSSELEGNYSVFNNTEIEGILVEDKIMYIVSNNKVGFDYIIEIMQEKERELYHE